MATTLGIGGQALLGCLAAAAVSLTLVVPALAEEAIGVALIDPFSGPFANVGTTAFRAFQMEFDRINSAGGTLGRSFKVVPFDSKSSAQEATLQVQAAIDQGLRYVFQGSGSNVAHAVSEAIAKYNARNPAAPVLYLNYGALDPALTDEKCHFWHFRLVAHGHMILNAVTGAAARRPQMRRVYLINQDYAWGQSVSKDARAMLAEKRPDVEIVGDDLHPLGKIKDFAPYVAKIKAAGADTVITGNWGNDLSLLVKAMRDSGGTIDMFAPIAGLQGTAAAMGESGAGRVRAVLFWHPNLEPNPLLPQALAFRSRYNEDWNWLPIYLAPEFLVRAINKARSAEPTKVAFALEGLGFAGPTGEVWIRPEDHQLMMPLFQTTFVKAGEPGVTYSAEDTGFGWKTEGVVETRANIPPVLCRVRPPAAP